MKLLKNYIGLLKILFLIAGLMLSIKPLVGFGIVHHAKSSEEGEVNIWLLQKLFSKRKQDYLEDDLGQIIAIQQKLAEPELGFISRFFYFLFGQITAPIALCHSWSSRFLSELALRILPDREIYLFFGKLTI
jgi:hypothetical protein